jgi:hypothetical protein
VMKAPNKLILQILQKEDLTDIIKTFTFPWSSLQAPQEKWERYYTEQQTNTRTVCIAKIGMVQKDRFSGHTFNAVPSCYRYLFIYLDVH